MSIRSLADNMELPGRCGDWLAPPPSPPRAHSSARHDERGVGTSTWPPAGTSPGHQWGLSHGHGHSARATDEPEFFRFCVEHRLRRLPRRPLSVKSSEMRFPRVVDIDLAGLFGLLGGCSRVHFTSVFHDRVQGRGRAPWSSTPAAPSPRSPESSGWASNCWADGSATNESASRPPAAVNGTAPLTGAERAELRDRAGGHQQEEEHLVPKASADCANQSK